MNTIKKDNKKKFSAKKSNNKPEETSNTLWMPLTMILPVLLAFVLTSEPVEAKKVSELKAKSEHISAIGKSQSRKLKKSKKKKVSSKENVNKKLKSLADNDILLAYDDIDDSDDSPDKSDDED
ncbi:MAG: hypothetical protein QNJ31_07215 [Candidatus Caenarcaniphilales bacterium]|nr:hypothetical protein [Candidatus Caenarcaniphilales bacterium]